MTTIALVSVLVPPATLLAVATAVEGVLVTVASGLVGVVGALVTDKRTWEK